MSDEYWEENCSTLSYASLAQRITNRPTINEDPRVKTIRTLQQEVDALHAELAQVCARHLLIVLYVRSCAGKR